jgi:hypothetical protein
MMDREKGDARPRSVPPFKIEWSMGKNGTSSCPPSFRISCSTFSHDRASGASHSRSSAGKDTLASEIEVTAGVSSNEEDCWSSS